MVALGTHCERVSILSQHLMRERVDRTNSSTFSSEIFEIAYAVSSAKYSVSAGTQSSGATSRAAVMPRTFLPGKKYSALLYLSLSPALPWQVEVLPSLRNCCTRSPLLHVSPLYALEKTSQLEGMAAMKTEGKPVELRLLQHACGPAPLHAMLALVSHFFLLMKRMSIAAAAVARARRMDEERMLKLMGEERGSCECIGL